VCVRVKLGMEGDAGDEGGEEGGGEGLVGKKVFFFFWQRVQ